MLPDTTHPAPELARLSFLIGTWATEGEILPGSAGIKGTDSYEWAAGGHFILHRINVLMAEEKTEAIEVIGYEPSTGTFTMRSFDNRGSYSVMEGRADQQGRLIIEGNGQRSELQLSDNGNEMKASWKKSEDGHNWQPWLEMRFRKM